MTRLFLDRSDFEARCRAGAASIYLGDHRALCRVLGELKMFVDTRDYALAPHLMLDGFWEAWITLGMARNLRPGMVAVDVGANLGYYTILMADRVSESGKVIAFEPNPHLAKMIEQSLTISGGRQQTAIRTEAVHSVSGRRLDFYVPNGRSMNATIVDSPRSSDEGENLIVETITLDDVLPEKVDFIKIDAEGAEREVWRGMSRVRAANPQLQIFLEFNPNRTAHYDPREFLAEMQHDGFQIAVVDHDGEAASISDEQVISDGEEVILYLKR